MEPGIAVASGCRLGEAPTWHEGERCVYFTDIPARRLHRFDPESGAHDIVANGLLVAGITVERDGALLLFGRWGAIHRYHERRVSPVRRIAWSHLGVRFNDVIADPAGRVFAGVMPYDPDTVVIRRFTRRIPRSGALCLVTRSGHITRLAPPVDRPNGMGFSPDLGWFYATDSGSRRVWAYRYDVDSGALSEPRVFVDLRHERGAPDGMVVDAEGCVWSARHRGGVVVRYDPNGREVARVTFPTPAITSLCFGGIDRRDLYVTSGGGGDPSNVSAGALFRFRAPVEGGPTWTSHIAC